MAASDASAGEGAPGTSPRRGGRDPKGTGRARGRAAPRPRHVPERTCVACRTVAGKRTLVRIVRTTAGGVEVDPTGRKNGRGAYLHADPACWDLALRRGALNAALKVTVAPEDMQALRAYRATLAGTSAAGPGGATEDPDETLPASPPQARGDTGGEPVATESNDHAEVPSATTE